MFGLVLLYAAMALISNGIARICLIDSKSQAVMNIFVGGLSLICNIIIMVHGKFSGDETAYYSAATGLLFSFTYLYIGVNGAFNLDPRLYAWYCLFVTINSIPIGFYSLAHQTTTHYNWFFSVMWWSWGAIWLTAWIEIVIKKPLGKAVGYASVFSGIFTAWIPGVLLLTGLWH